MTAAEATVDAMAAHGIRTIYALPGVQNDYLFAALFKASDRMRTVHTRHEQGAAYMALGARSGDRQALGLRRGAGAGLAQFRGRPAHRLFDECAGAGAHRRDSRRRYRTPSRASARDPRPGRDHQAAGGLFRADPKTRAGAAAGRRGHAVDGVGPAGPGVAAMRDRCLGQIGSGDTAAAAARTSPQAQRSRDPQGRQAPGRCKKSADRLRRRRARRVRGSHRAVRHAAGAGARLSARPRRAGQPRSVERRPCRSAATCGARPT